MTFSLEKIAEFIGATLIGDPSTEALESIIALDEELLTGKL